MSSEVLDRFVEQSPVSVMFRGTFETVITPKLLDEMFADTAKRQRCGELLFSSLVDLLGLVATGARKSVNDAYRAKKEQFSVSVTAVYEKLQGVETEVSRQTVRQTASQMAEVVKRLDAARQPLLRGHRVKIIENAFQELGQALHSEIKTLGYPKAALFSFCVTILAYNVISVVKTALTAVHGEKAERHSLSGYYLAAELGAACHGMAIAVPERQWKRHFASLTPAQLARVLKTIAAKVRPDRFRKNTRGPKKPPLKRSSAKRHPHVSTARIPAQRKAGKVHAVKA